MSNHEPDAEAIYNDLVNHDMTILALADKYKLSHHRINKVLSQKMREISAERKRNEAKVIIFPETINYLSL